LQSSIFARALDELQTYAGPSLDRAGSEILLQSPSGIKRFVAATRGQVLGQTEELGWDVGDFRLTDVGGKVVTGLLA
jgi:hypothetical protein